MKVAEVMTKEPAYCGPETNLAAAIEILWNRDCGILPVVDSQGRVVGLVTDRDICVALGTRNQMPSDMTVSEVSSGRVVACKPDDDLRTALATMAKVQVHRLAVLDDAGRLQGVLSIADVVLRAQVGNFGSDAKLSFEDIVNTIKSVCAPQPLRAAQKSAAA
jgi:CBS domain-containing protein